MDYAKALSETFLFKNSPAAVLEKLGTIARESRLADHDQLFREGDEGNALYVIVIGTVKVSKRDAQGHEEDVATLGTGSYLGEMSLVMDNHVRTASATAQEKSVLVELRRADIEKLCDTDDQVAHHFYKAIARGLAKRLNATTVDAAHYKAIFKSRGHD